MSMTVNQRLRASLTQFGMVLKALLHNESVTRERLDSIEARLATLDGLEAPWRGSGDEEVAEEDLCPHGKVADACQSCLVSQKDCRHGGHLGACDECDVESDLAYDARRERG